MAGGFLFKNEKMAFTQQQLEAALRITGTYSLINGAASFTDVTNYAGLGIASPDTVKTILYVTDPTGALFYKNAGYDTANFAAPDLEPINNDATFNYPTLPTDITGAYLQGQYTVNMKVQVVEGSDTTIGFKVLYQNVTATCNGIVPVVAGQVSYNTAIVSVTDNTSYKTWTALTNTLTLYPPAQSGQSSQTLTAHGAPATLVYDPPVGTYPYTGVWTWTLTSDITYTDPLTGASTTCRITAQGNFSVVQSQLCKVYCAVKTYRGEVLAMAAQRQTYTELAEQNLVKAEGEYFLAWAASMCGKPQTEIDVYIARVYTLINKSPDCDCGCGDGTSQPLVPTSIINGTNGTNGSVIYSGTAAPSNGAGANGDYYIRTGTGDLYVKVGGVWSVIMNIIGATGATGASGTSILANQFPNLATLSTNFESLLDGRAAYSMPADTLNTNLDEIQIIAQAVCSNPDSQQLRITFNGLDLFGAFDYPTFYGNSQLIKIFIRLTRITNTTANYYAEGRFYGDVPAPSNTRALLFSGELDLTNLSSLDFTGSAYDIDFQAKSIAIGDVTSTYFEVVYLHKI